MMTSGKLLLLTYTATVIVFLSTTISCQHEPELIPGTEEICFDEKIMPVINSNCAVSGCHDGSDHELPALTNYEQVLKMVDPGKPNASKLYKVTTAWKISPNFMPPSPRPPLNNKQLDDINLWIAQGAKHTTCSETGCDTTNITFSASVFPVFSAFCAGCHSGNNPEAGISLTDYAGIVTAVNSGRLVGSIEQQQGYSAMPKNGSKLSDCKITIIEKWIDNGMLNN